MTDVYAIFKFLFADHGKKTQSKQMSLNTGNQ